jgi:hypothetical protein
MSFEVTQVPVDTHHEEEETEHDKEMHDKLARFMEDSNLDGDDEEEEVDADEHAKKELNVPTDLPENYLDHVVLATNDLVEGMELFEKMTGVKPTKLGSLRGVGTKSARVNLNNNVFVEIIGPDPKAPSAEGMAPNLSDLPEGKLIPFHYAIRSKPENLEIPAEVSWQRDDVTMIYVDSDEYNDSGKSSIHKWDLMLLYGHGLGGIVPAFVNWRENEFHPTARLERTDAKLNSVKVQAPSGHYAHDLLGKAKGISISQGPTKLSFTFDTPKGMVSFSASEPEGIVMPGYGDDNHPSMRRAD